MDSSPERDSAGDDYFIFTGSGDAPGSSDCQIQRYHAPVFRVYNRAFVFDTGYLSDVNLAGSSPYRGQYNINPLTNMVQMFRNVMFYNTLPTFSSIVLGMAEVAVVLVLGTYVFYKNQDEFILNI